MASRKGGGGFTAGSKGLRHIGPGGRNLDRGGTGKFSHRGGGRMKGTVGGQRRDKRGRFA